MLACRFIKRTVNLVILNLFSSVGIVGPAPIEAVETGFSKENQMREDW
jgi:hypothetical protein